MVDKNRHIILPYSTIVFHENGLAEIKVEDYALIDIAECEEITAVFKSNIGENKVPVLHIVGKYSNATKEARDYMASDIGTSNSIAEAFVFTSLAHKIIGNFYLKFNKPKVPTQFFKTREEAIVWLLTFVK